MLKRPWTTPVADTVPKVDGEVAVGEDIRFQRRWWMFERAIWAFFILLIGCDLAGAFGQGWLSKAKATVPDKSLSIDYERIARSGTPSTMVLHFGPSAIHDGQTRVFLSDSVVKDLGAIRIAPQPAASTIGEGGIAYTFLATTSPAQVEVQLQPAHPGRTSFRVAMPGQPAIVRQVFVMP